MDILIEDLEGSLWVAGVDKKNRIQTLEIDPYPEIIRWGSIYMAQVGRIDAANNAAYVDLGHGFQGILYVKDVRTNDPEGQNGKKIGQLLRPGQMIMVQVKTPRNPAGWEVEDNISDHNKASKVSMDIALPGRYMIYTPFSDSNRVSKRITDPAMRAGLKEMVKQIDSIQGCILRSSAMDCQTEVLVREGKILRAIWDNLCAFDGESEPTLLMLGPDAIQRTLADLAGETINSIAVATMDIFEDTEEWCDLFAPDLMTKIEPRAAENTRSGMGLFEVHDLIGQFEDLLQSYLVLPSGGSIIIEKTAAMTVIDVNSGGDKNALNANLEAAAEIARQLRIRNIGGTIMIDFITMKSASENKKILAILEKSFADDPCTAQCHGITKLGVFEISRQRRIATLEEKLYMIEDQDNHSE